MGREGGRGREEGWRRLEQPMQKAMGSKVLHVPDGR